MATKHKNPNTSIQSDDPRPPPVSSFSDQSIQSTSTPLSTAILPVELWARIFHYAFPTLSSFHLVINDKSDTRTHHLLHLERRARSSPAPPIPVHLLRVNRTFHAEALRQLYATELTFSPRLSANTIMRFFERISATHRERIAEVEVGIDTSRCLRALEEYLLKGLLPGLKRLTVREWDSVVVVPVRSRKGLERAFARPCWHLHSLLYVLARWYVEEIGLELVSEVEDVGADADEGDGIGADGGGEVYVLVKRDVESVFEEGLRNWDWWCEIEMRERVARGVDERDWWLGFRLTGAVRCLR